MSICGKRYGKNRRRVCVLPKWDAGHHAMRKSLRQLMNDIGR